MYKVNVLTSIVPMQVDYITLLSFQEEFLHEFTSLRDGLKDLRVPSDICKYCLEYHKNLIQTYSHFGQLNFILIDSANKKKYKLSNMSVYD